MKRLLKIEWMKIRSNGTFWVLMGLHVGIILLVVLSGKIVLSKLSLNGENFSKLVSPANIPIYQFPDIWQNITYVAGFLKFILGFYIIISITNEISFNTLRQNVMNGLSRADFFMSKFNLIIILAIISTAFIFVTSLLFGLTYTHPLELKDMVRYSGFLPAYFLQLTVYLVFSLLIGLLIKRTGLAMGLLLLYTILIEPLVSFQIKQEWIKGFLPLKAINNLIHNPFNKYLLREIQDYVSFKEILIVVIYAALFVFLINLLLKKRDL